MRPLLGIADALRRGVRGEAVKALPTKLELLIALWLEEHGYKCTCEPSRPHMILRWFVVSPAGQKCNYSSIEFIAYGSTLGFANDVDAMQSKNVELRALVGELVEALHNASVLVKILGNGDSELTAEWDDLTTKAKEQVK